MSAINSYGCFDLPEEKAKIEVVENPLQVLTASYELFRKSIKVITNESKWEFDGSKRAQIYEKAVNLFKGKEDLQIESVGSKKILDVLSRARSCDGTGLFLSALLNKTSINDLIVDDFPAIVYLGYKLAPKKKFSFRR